MARQPRIVVPGIPHHVTQRGNRKQLVFFSDEDYAYYRSILITFSERSETRILAWCLMPNHIHVVAIPKDEDGLRATFAPLNRAYAQAINKREEWSGHLWQARFSSLPLDDPHTIAALRYVDLNPVRAGLTQSPLDYRWSSARAHVLGEQDGVTDLDLFKEIVDDPSGLLSSGLDEQQLETFHKHEINGFPLGDERFLNKISKDFGQRTKAQKRGGSRYRSQK